MNDKINEKIINKIPKGESCVDENGICPFWKPLVKDHEDIIRARCELLDFNETQDYQGTFLWGMLKICNIKNELE